MPSACNQDTALVLSRFNSIILARVFGHKDVEELAELATVPGMTVCTSYNCVLANTNIRLTLNCVVINALSEKYHPLQALADYMTIKVRALSSLSYCCWHVVLRVHVIRLFA